MPSVQKFNWVFTFNGLEVNEKYQSPEWLEERLAKKGAEGWVFQLEMGESGNIHWQGCVHFKEKKTMFACKKILKSAHWEGMKGNWQQAKDYCIKPETAMEGVIYRHEPEGMCEQGERNDLQAIVDAVNDGNTNWLRLAENFPTAVARSMKFVDRLLALKAKKRTWQTEVIVIWGKTGMGKTTAVWETYPDLYVKDNSQWWDDYQGEEVVLWDDFRGNYDYDELLRVLDRRPIRGQVKGSYIQLQMKKVFITSNQHPSEWYKAKGKRPGKQYEGGPLERRLGDQIYELPRDALKLVEEHHELVLNPAYGLGLLVAQGQTSNHMTLDLNQDPEDQEAVGQEVPEVAWSAELRLQQMRAQPACPPEVQSSESAHLLQNGAFVIPEYV